MTTLQTLSLLSRFVYFVIAILAVFLASLHAHAADKCLATLKPLVIQIEFNDIPRNIGTPFVKKKFLNELDEYIREMSNNRVCINGEITEKWYRLPKPMANYWVPWQNNQVDRQNVRNLVSDSLNAADDDYDVSKYDFVMLVLAANFKEWGNQGIAAYPGMLGWKSDEILYTKSGRKVNRGIAVYAQSVHLGHIFHDVGHVLGGVKDGNRVLPCLYDQTLQGRSTSRDPSKAFENFTASQIHMGGWDPMSCNSCRQRPAPPGISSWSRLRLGWIDPAKISEVKPGEKVQIRLGPLEDPSSGTMVIKIPLTSSTYYLVENRQFIGYDKNLPEEGVLIMFANDLNVEGWFGNGPVRLVNANPSVAHLESAAFDIGKNDTFTDAKNGLSIKLVAKDGRAYDILVERLPQKSQ